jgi:hypothetical protein
MSEIIKIEDFFSASNHKLIIRDIFAMYHHNWDIVGELIQNAVDSVLITAEQPPTNYKPNIKITYNARTREIVVEDNGIGIPSGDVRKIAAPHVSLKKSSEATRGEFGVGLTFGAFSSNDFRLESIFRDTKSILEVKNGYSWTMDEEDNEKLEILFTSEGIPTDTKSYTKVYVKPARFPEYSFPQLKYILQRYTAIGDFWACFKEEDGPIKVDLVYIDSNKRKEESIPNRLWHPADFLKLINVETVDLTDVTKEVEKGKEYAMPNWIGFGLTDKDTLSMNNKDFTYYALFCRIAYYEQLSEKIGISSARLEEENEDRLLTQPETVSSGIFICKKGMALGATVDYPKKVLAGFWRMIFVIINCDTLRTEPGRKKLHVDDEQIVKKVAAKIFDQLTKYHHYFIPRDPDEETQSLLRNVDKTIDDIKIYVQSHPLINPANKIAISVEPKNEQTLIALFHELIGGEVLKGYKAHRLSATETYDGIYDYKIERPYVGNEHWNEWLQFFPAKERKEIENKKLYFVDFMIVEFKMHLEDIIKDFLQKTKYHPHIKLIVAWDANKDSIKRRGWLLEDLPQSKQKFFGARWRLRPSAEGQTRGILATDVLLLKDFLQKQNET